MSTIAAFFRKATRTLADAGIATARLDSLVLLADMLSQDKSWIIAHPEHELEAAQLQTLEANLAERSNHIPLAYIRAKQEFYGREFVVNTDVLIPRPETEELIEQIKALKPQAGSKLLDVGTGSGAIAVTAALELPKLRVEACDISEPVLNVARQNATRLKATITFFESDLLQNASGPYDIIIANLPYVDKSWERSAETNAEPALALFADDAGLALIKKLLAQIPNSLRPGGHVILEADPRQHKAIEKAARLHGLVQTAAEGFALCFALQSGAAHPQKG
jgi:release factor glutamine methyltransferase